MGYAIFTLCFFVLCVLDAVLYGLSKYPERMTLGLWRYLPFGGIWAYIKFGPDR